MDTTHALSLEEFDRRLRGDAELRAWFARLAGICFGGAVSAARAEMRIGDGSANEISWRFAAYVAERLDRDAEGCGT